MMNSAPHLLVEDRPEFERALDEALRMVCHRAESAGDGPRLSAAELQARARESAHAIAARADREYRRFVALRAELHQSAVASPVSAATTEPSEPEGEVGETNGAGLVAVIAVLTPVLTSIAAVIFLLVGYLLRLIDPEPSLAEPMRTAGWVFAALAATGLLIGGIGLLVTALRNGTRGSRQHTAPAANELSHQVSLAEAQWREALLEHGIVPFLQRALAEEAAARRTPPPVAPRPTEGGRTPQLGYSRPGFTSPAPRGPGGTSGQPRFSSPDYGRPEYGSPDFSSPDDVPQ